MTTITLKVPQAFLDDLDATWRAEDFPSRSEFVRWALRDAITHPSFSRKAWKEIAVSEHQLATGEGDTDDGDEIRSRPNEETDGGE
ncbi:ribbon-helix-helix domain-containing protein [Halopenitus sp. POP-27]|uniref:ribbon-helix-helix domain-containing protein n=1 Tax=Halopenitus sp. POP-27 TaxID=2994425 RepID=UPI0024689FFF|nr:ribbon-helix-helix domain-containing protein [Halopenitus sp. POP-27]